jgi:hypothetical protein
MATTRRDLLTAALTATATVAARPGSAGALQDSDIQGLGAKQQHVYTVRFAARDLWGEQASRHDSVYAGMWEGYLEST